MISYRPWMLCVLCVLVAAQDEEERVRVNTKYGPVDGMAFPLHTGNTVNAFLAIPYARPPIDELRWMVPEEPEPWTEPLDAVTLGSACIQNPLITHVQITHPGWSDFSEDCLHLNIYTPADTSRGPYPVMLWIHGGSNQAGANLAYPGYFLADRNVVVVIPNYRVNIFGFGSTKDASAPGNYGLLDQIQALRFVQENIAAFGGDPEQVTIFGQSAGGLNTGLMLMSPLAEGLFHRAILQSGTELVPWGTLRPDDEENYMLQVADQMDCPTDDGEEMMDCLRNKNARSVRLTNVTCTPGYDCDWKPIVDGVVLPDTPRNLRATGNYNKVPEMVGVTTEDGFLFMPPASFPGLNRTDFESIIRSELTDRAPSFADPDRLEDVVQAALFMYTPWPYVDDRVANRDALGRYDTDEMFGSPADAQAKLHAADDNDVYFYVYNYRANTTRVPEWRGSVHASEIAFVFGYPFLQFNEAVLNHTGFGTLVDYVEPDMALSEHMITMWTNFAKSGSPTPTPVRSPVLGDEDVTWPRFTADDHSYLWIGSEVVEKRSDYRQDYYAFMEYYFRNLAYAIDMP